MFSRAQGNALEGAVNKATDENLTSENWEYILAVCDKVDADPERGPRDAIAAVQKRLAYKNANVQLFALSLAEALSKNCGSKVHREMASRAFTQSLVKIMTDRTVHKKVRTRCGELIKHWTDDFKSDPSLGIMNETYRSLKQQGISVEPPSLPQKREISDVDRRREEEELQLALAMSLSETRISSHPTSTGATTAGPSSSRAPVDEGPNEYSLPAYSDYHLPTATATAYVPENAQNEMTAAQQALAAKPIEERTAATVSRVRALYDFTASEAGELTFRRGDVIYVIESAYKDWWRGSLHGTVGIFPTNYVENLADPTPEELAREAEEERKVFDAAKNVEKLLSILSSADANDPRVAEDDNLQNLYHSTLSLRPKLVRLIETYAQKKDELILLNEKFMKARRDYDDLMEASLAQYNTSSYGRGYRPSPQQASIPRQASGQQAEYANGYGYQNPVQQPYQQGLQQSGPQQQVPLAQHYAQATTPTSTYKQQTDSYAQQQPYQARVPSQQHTQQQQHPPPQQQRQHQHQQQQQQPAQASYSQGDLRTAQPYMAQGSRQSSRSNIPNNPVPANVPTSPSQELAQAFPEQPRTSQPAFAPSQPHAYPSSPGQMREAGARQVKSRSSSYDHARAEKEGGPPISYYTAGEDNDSGHTVTYQTPQIPIGKRSPTRSWSRASQSSQHNGTSTQNATPAMSNPYSMPSAPPEDDAASYYYYNTAGGATEQPATGNDGGHVGGKTGYY
ncbi:ESCRT-0 subunit protein hse1 [Savitreella phatthalungensis]